MKRKSKGIAFLLLGFLLLSFAFGLYAYNLAEDENAGKQASDILDKMDVLQKNIISEKNVPVQNKTETSAYANSSGDYAQKEGTETSEVQNEVAEQEDKPSVIIIDGEAFCGKLEIEKLEIILPIYDELSYARLKTAPCRYIGGVSTDDIIIAAHNYKSHFGNLNKLEIGDEVKFTDPSGAVHLYSVREIATLDGTAISDMQSGGWDLTLFTCTKGGKQRVTVRCERKC